MAPGGSARARRTPAGRAATAPRGRSRRRRQRAAPVEPGARRRGESWACRTSCGRIERHSVGFSPGYQPSMGWDRCATSRGSSREAGDAFRGHTNRTHTGVCPVCVSPSPPKTPPFAAAAYARPGVRASNATSTTVPRNGPSARHAGAATASAGDGRSAQRNAATRATEVQTLRDRNGRYMVPPRRELRQRSKTLSEVERGQKDGARQGASLSALPTVVAGPRAPMGPGARFFSARTPWDTDQTGPRARSQWDHQTGPRADARRTSAFRQTQAGAPSPPDQ